MRQNVRFQTAGGEKGGFPPPLKFHGSGGAMKKWQQIKLFKIIKLISWERIKLSIGPKLITVQLIFVKKVPQMKIWWKLIYSETHIIVDNVLTSRVYFIFTLNDSFNFFNILLDVAFEIFQKPKNLWVLKGALHVNTVRIHNTRFNTSKSKKKDCQNMLQV